MTLLAMHGLWESMLFNFTRGRRLQGFTHTIKRCTSSNNKPWPNGLHFGARRQELADSFGEEVHP